MPVRATLVVLGLLIVAMALNDLFQSVIVPRAVGRRYRISHVQTRVMWWLWPRFARVRFPSDDNAREDFLALFAPFNLMLTLIVWSACLLIGYGMIFYALRGQVHPPIRSFSEAVYFAGASFFTIGFGDFAGTTIWTRVFSLAAGASGFGLVSITTAFLFALFGAFQTREQFVVTIGARAGSPPSGVGLMTIAARAGVVKDLSILMRSAETWCASLMETHLAYPALAYFRSSHDYESWVATLGTLLDSAVLMMTTVQCDGGEARILYNVGRHAAHDISNHFHLDGDGRDPGVTRDQYDEVYEHLQSVGLAMHEREHAWEKFSQLRATYAGHIAKLAAYFDVPQIQWLGDRSLISSEHIRMQIDPEILTRIEGVQKP